ncbi:putative UDP-rhamnose:rhamnosyltransferase 1 [Benincasa hispida]|uniref:putative UDP-rhamnose:rhamnosyltransferase 1 n=1 Tax=Benincasa hispida TaxID=102211 RepID=UPI001901B1AE|nr:putative UDP-rhamnose:rhamnosyltransferase 1 [Benincasa hispida]
MAENKDLHVVVFPWSAFGHLIPHFQLSIALAKAGVHVSFISTPKNLQRLPPIPPSLSPFITPVPIPLPKLPGDPLPEGAEATVDIPFDKIPFLKLALDLAEPPFRKFIADHPHPPDWFIVDFNATWVCDISQEFRIPIVFFRVLTPGFLAFFTHVLGTGLPLSEIESLTSPPPIDGSMVAYRRHEAAKIRAGFFEKNDSGMSDLDRVTKIISACRAIAVRSCYEFDVDYLKLYSNNCGKKVIPIGLLPPQKSQKTEFKADSPWKSTFQWLDQQNPQSVVFVGFGSECKLTKDQINEIARGVELSELPFLWALRKPDWAEDSDALPVGFLDRMVERGIVSMGWAPQMEILGHPAIGGSLFHGGWGSAIEALQFGHCLVLLPFIVDQPLNARLLVEKGFAVEVERKEEDGSFSGEAIAKALRDAMISEEGEKIRKQAKEAAAIFGDNKLHQRYIEEFVQFLQNGDSN